MAVDTINKRVLFPPKVNDKMITTASVSIAQPSAVSSVTLRSGLQDLDSETSLRYYKTLITPPPQKRFLSLEETLALKNDTVQAALKRYKPFQPLDAKTIQSTAPLVDFLANPHAKKNILTSVLAVFWASLGLALGIVNAKEKKDMKLPHEVFKTSLWVLGGASLGFLLGQILGAPLDRNQRWANDWVLTLIGMTSPQTAIRDANKALQQRTNQTMKDVLNHREAEELDRLRFYDSSVGLAEPTVFDIPNNVKTKGWQGLLS